MSACPCGSGLAYDDCCGRWHGGAAAPTAEALMRSRYSAYVLGDSDYLRAPWHPSTRPAELTLDARLQWFGLDIRRREHGGPDDEQGIVEFVARGKVNGRAERLHEGSRFVKEEGRWFYVDGELQERSGRRRR